MNRLSATIIIITLVTSQIYGLPASTKQNGRKTSLTTKSKSTSEVSSTQSPTTTKPTENDNLDGTFIMTGGTLVHLAFDSQENIENQDDNVAIMLSASEINDTIIDDLEEFGNETDTARKTVHKNDIEEIQDSHLLETTISNDDQPFVENDTTETTDVTTVETVPSTEIALTSTTTSVTTTNLPTPTTTTSRPKDCLDYGKIYNKLPQSPCSPIDELHKSNNGLTSREMCSDHCLQQQNCVAFAYSHEERPNCLIYDTTSIRSGGECQLEDTVGEAWIYYEQPQGCHHLSLEEGCRNSEIQMKQVELGSRNTGIFDCGDQRVVTVDLDRGDAQAAYECSEACKQDETCLLAQFITGKSKEHCFMYDRNPTYDRILDLGDVKCHFARVPRLANGQVNRALHGVYLYEKLCKNHYLVDD